MRRHRAGLAQLHGYERLLACLEALHKLTVRPFDHETALIFHALERQRLRVGTMDLKISAICLAHDALLLSRNLADFEKVPGLGTWGTGWTTPPAKQEKKRLHRAANDEEDTVTTARKLANSNAKGFLATARRMLLGDFGPAPGGAWDDAGWPPGTTGSPDNIEDRQQLLDKLRALVDGTLGQEGCQVGVQVVGRDAAPVPREPRQEPGLTLEDLPTGATVRVTVHAANVAGRGAVSAVAEVRLA